VAPLSGKNPEARNRRNFGALLVEKVFTPLTKNFQTFRRLGDKEQMGKEKAKGKKKKGKTIAPRGVVVRSMPAKGVGTRILSVSRQEGTRRQVGDPEGKLNLEKSARHVKTMGEHRSQIRANSHQREKIVFS